MPHMKLVIVLALSTAARIGALLDLTWTRVDFDRRKILLHNPNRAVTAKGRATVPMNDMAYVMLMEMRAGALSPYVIEWGGKKVGSVKRGIVRAGERSGLKVSPHVLRHTAAVWMVEGGVSMEEVSQYLGHRDI
jgi:integrase